MEGGCPTNPSRDAGSGRAFSAPLDEEWVSSDCCAHQLQVREVTTLIQHLREQRPGILTSQVMKGGK